MKSLERVGVVGAGVMGRGIAQALAETGHGVILVDASEQILSDAMSAIGVSVRMRGLFRDHRPLAPDRSDVVSRIRPTLAWEALGEADLVVESVTERVDVKRDVLGRIDAASRREAVIASNTSAIAIGLLASVTSRPDQVLGLHFMNPAPLTTAVEVIRGRATSAETEAIACRLVERMGKKPIVVNDAPGFVSNRVLMLTINEAIAVLADGVATVEEVDEIFRSCMGHKMGPLELADLIGLDTVRLSLEVLMNAYGDRKFTPCPLLVKLAEAGALGQKSGEGFYSYRPDASQMVSELLCRTAETR